MRWLLRSHCDWDDTYTAPPTPVAVAGQCLNAVVAIHYQLQWYGGSVTRINATLVLSNLSMVTLSLPTLQKKINN